MPGAVKLRHFVAFLWRFILFLRNSMNAIIVAEIPVSEMGGGGGVAIHQKIMSFCFPVLGRAMLSLPRCWDTVTVMSSVSKVRSIY